MFTGRDRSPSVSSPLIATRSPLRGVMLAGASLLIGLAMPASPQAADVSFDKVTMTYSQFGKMDPTKAMKAMDPENRGYVTREEFLKFQEKLFDNIAKQDPDRITMKEWQNQASQKTAGK